MSLRAIVFLVMLSSGWRDALASPAEPKLTSSNWAIGGGFTSHGLARVGAHLGAEYALTRSERFASLAQVSLQAYGIADDETGYALQTRWGQRYTASFGLTVESHLGLGVQHTRWQRTIYRFVDGVAETETRTHSGNAIIPHVAVGPGYDASNHFGISLHIYTRLGLVLLYPDLNDVFNLNAVAEVGVRWTL